MTLTSTYLGDAMSNKISLEVVGFEREMERIREEVRELADLSLHETVDYATDQLRIVTPVDSGEARRGWRNNNFTLKSISGFERVAIISNDVDHIVYLNQGSSKQAPKYFIEQVLSTIGLITPN